MNRHQLVTGFFLFFFGFVVFQALRILSPFAQPIFWAAILSFGFYPVHVRIRRHLNGHDGWTAFLTTAVIFLAFVPLVLVIVLSLAGESVKLYQWAIDAVREHRYEAWWDRLMDLRPMRRIEAIVGQWEVVQTNYKGWIAAAFRSIVAAAGTPAAVVTRGILLFPLNFLLTFFLVFFFLRDGEKIYAFVYDATPLEEPDRHDVFERVTGTFEAVIRGQLLTALIQALLAGIIFWSLGIPLPIFFASVTFLTALIPVLGAPMVWFPLTLYLVFKQAIAKAIVLFLLGAFGISLVDNFLKPVLIGGKTKLPYLLLFLGILGGVQVYGLMGMFLAPVVLSLFFVLLKIYREKFL